MVRLRLDILLFYLPALSIDGFSFELSMMVRNFSSIDGMFICIEPREVWNILPSGPEFPTLKS